MLTHAKRFRKPDKVDKKVTTDQPLSQIKKTKTYLSLRNVHVIQPCASKIVTFTSYLNCA